MSGWSTTGAAGDGHPGAPGEAQRPDSRDLAARWPRSATRCSPTTASGSSCCAPRARRSRPGWTGRCSPPASTASPAWSGWPPWTTPTLDATIDGFQQAFAWWRDDRVVSIAAVQGHAVGAGFQLALACDLRVLADDAQLAMKETVPRAGARPRRHPAAGRPGGLLPRPRDLRHRPLGRRRGGGRDRAGHRRRTGRASSTRPPATWPPPLLAAPAGAVRATKALLRGAGATDVRRAAGRRARGAGRPAARPG